MIKVTLLAEMTRMNNLTIDLDGKAAQELVTQHGVKIMKTPEDVLKAQLEAADKVFDTEAKKNPFFAKVLASQRDFAARVVPHAARIRPPLERAVEHYWAK
jgi:TRAP-type mannitol/chloroaromatic compound transport system substrate-binding protein